MKIYLDLFFIFNVFMDMIIIMGVTSILKRRTSFIRIIISSLIGGISSLLLLNDINKLVIEIVSIIVMTIISFGYKNMNYTLKNIFYMYMISTLIGGLLYLFRIKIDNSFLYYLVIIIISIEVVILYIKEMNKLKNNYNNYYKVNIYFNEKPLSLTGFVDTGNNLYDPYKHRPIILISDKYLDNNKYILVPYHTASGNDLLKCIKPKYIEVNQKKVTNVMVGFSNNIKLNDGIEVILHKAVMKGD